MKRFILFSFGFAMLAGLLTAGVLYAHDASTPSKLEDVEVTVKNIDNGLQVTITSDKPEVVKAIKERSSWYQKVLKHIASAGMHGKKMNMDCPMQGKGMMGGGMMGGGMMNKDKE